jgi:DNA-binding response OmpR family regulator
MDSADDILVVDDDAPIVDFIAKALRDEGYVVRTALSAAAAHAAMIEQCPALVLLDLHLPGKTGDILAQDLKHDGLDDVPVVIMTADARAAQELSMGGVVYCLIKPFALDELIDCVAKYIRRNCSV